jgi:hypothetical protein
MEEKDPAILGKDERPAVACPHCAAHTAQVKSVSTTTDNSGVVNVQMFCRDCEKTWVVQKATYDGALPA